MKIRQSTFDETALIIDLHRSAFGDPEGETIAKLINQLFSDQSAQPILSLVAEENSTLIGSVIFSKVTIDGASDCISACILAPLAVHKEHQGKGIGMKLMKQGLETLQQRGVHFVFVLGDPAYYTRAGFSPNHKINAPHKLEYPEAWMAISLQDKQLSSVNGTVQCATTLNAPEHW